MPISALPTPPSRQDPTNFNDRADAFLGALPQFQSEANTLEANVNEREESTVAASNTALAAVNIVKWVSGTTYDNGQAVWSPINGLGYRRITTSGSGTTDPSLDTTNYKQISGTGDVSTSGNQTIAGTKTFSSTIAGNINGNSASVTNGVYTIGDQTIAGTKTFSSNIIANVTGTASNASQLNGQSAGFYQTALGYSPVRQGTGPGQSSNTVSIGWDNIGTLLLSVDNNNQPNWPINLTPDRVLTAYGGGASVNAVGTYIFALNRTTSVISENGTIAGSNLVKASSFYFINDMGTIPAGNLSGTWRLMQPSCPGQTSYVDESGTVYRLYAGFWVRIS